VWYIYPVRDAWDFAVGSFRSMEGSIGYCCGVSFVFVESEPNRFYDWIVGGAQMAAYEVDVVVHSYGGGSFTKLL